MTVERRVLCGIAGAALVLYVVGVFQFNHPPPRSFCICCAAWYRLPEPYDTITGYLVSATSFYLLCAAAVGDRLRSCYWFLYLLIAHVLAAALVGGMVIWWELFKPDDWNIED